MNKNEAIKEVKSLRAELDFVTQDLTKQVNHWKGEHARLKKAYSLSEKYIRKLEQNQK